METTAASIKTLLRRGPCCDGFEMKKPQYNAFPMKLIAMVFVAFGARKKKGLRPKAEISVVRDPN